jgi:hypothetical protein
MYEIEKNIPVPPKNAARRKFPLENMEVGESFAFEGKASQVSPSIQSVKHMNPGWQFTTRKVDDTHIRVWRTA